jgi:hypothetical protein
METISGKPTPAHCFQSDPYEKKEFPAVVYRGKDEVESKTVGGDDELKIALADGWRESPKE